jgi:Tol biopolymer transport system component
LKIADFVDNSKKPHLANIKIITPGWKKSCFYENHAFSKDDKKILFSGDLIPEQTPYGLDIYEFGLESKRLIRLTKTDEDWDKHAHYSPDGTKIAWMSSTGFKIDWNAVHVGKHFDYLSTELWIMDANGSNPQRLTYFNEFGHRYI